MTTKISEANIQTATLNNLGGGPTIGSIVVTDNSYTNLDDTAVALEGGFIKLIGSKFATGCQVLIGLTPATSVTFISETEVRAQVPATAAGTYIVYLVNPDGGTAIRVNAVTFSGTPTWVSGSALAGTVDTVISIQLSATDAATFELAAGSTLPPGVSLSSSGLLSGTITGITQETVYNFTINAIDTELQDSPRSFAFTVTAGDQFFNSTTLLLPGSATTFVQDASTNNFPITVVGDTRPNNFGPYTPGYYSNYFDGTGDSLQTTTNIQSLGTGNFTLEGWYYPTATASFKYLFSIGSDSNFSIVLDNNVLAPYFYAGGTIILSSISLTINRWNHVAFVRNSGTLTVYINGVSGGSAAFGASVAAGIGYLAQQSASAYFYTGYQSNVRLTNTAVYTSAFTPSTTPLTAITGTSLLTCQSNRFIDNSTNNFAITRNGDARIDGFDPFVPSTEFLGRGSTYFDGTGDYLSLSQQTALSFGTGDFTVEAWVYPTANPASYWSIMDARGSANTVPWAAGLRLISGNLKLEFYTGTQIQGSITVPLNTWTHIAYTRSGTTFKGFVNGVVDINTTLSTNLNIAAGTQYIGALVDPAYNTGYISNLRVVKGTAVYTSAFTPPTQPLTAITNTSLLTCQTNQPNNNNVFLDSSTNNFLITRNGNTTQGTFSPYAENWSNYFDGGTNRLTTAGSSAFNLTGTSITLECWVYMTAAPSVVNRLISIGPNAAQSSLVFGITTGRVLDVGVPFGSGGSVNSGANLIPLNTWTHLAFVLSSGTGTIYINGTQVGQTSGWNITSSNSNYFYIGYDATATVDGKFTGYVSNVRLVRGTALYTANFTPSTTPLQPIQNTSLLTCRDGSFVDDSANRFAMTVVGNTSVQKFGPFAGTTLPTPYYGAFFDGTGDYLTVSDNPAFDLSSGNFTFEVWVYPTSAYTVGTEQFLLDQWGSANYGYDFSLITNGSSFTGLRFAYSQTGAVGNITTRNYTQAIPMNQWSHIAFVRSSGTTTAYYNGTSVGTSSDNVTIFNSTQTVHIGASPDGGINQLFHGYLSNMRLVKGTAVYTSNFTPPTQPLTAITNTSLLTCQSATFIDNSTNNFAITAFGNSQPTFFNPFTVTYSTLQSYSPSVFGGSMYFDGTGDFLALPANNSFATGTGDFTIEGWIYVTDLSAIRCICGTRTTADTTTGWNLAILTNGSMQIYDNTGYAATGAGTVAVNTWCHFAFVRQSNVMYSYINGTQRASTANTRNWTQNTFWIGANGGSTEPFAGYMSDIRFVKGQALYTSNFVPSNQPLTAIQNTILLSNGTGAGIYDVSTVNNLETIGNAQISTSVVKFGTGSLAFDGSGDYLISNAASSDLYAFGTGNFTVEFWLYLNSTSAAQVFYDGRPASSQGLQPTIYTNSGTLFYYTNAATRITGSSLSANIWYHIAVARSGTSTKMFVDGTQVGSTYTDSTNYVNPALRPMIGADGFNNGTPGGNPMNGYISDFRITKGVARYTANFAAPATAHQTR